MKNKMEAKLIDGPHKGQVIDVDGAPTRITIVSRIMERTGKFREVFRANYVLVSNTKAFPLRYEFKDSN